MSSRSNQSPGLNQAGSSEARMTGENRSANVPSELRDLLERGEISPETFALYTSMSAQLVAACRGAKKEPALPLAGPSARPISLLQRTS
jgi:hypothetical protein